MSTISHLVLLGGPGSGKGTLSKTLNNYHGFVQISTGDILRDHIKRQTEIGKKAAEYAKTGRLMDDETIFEILRNELKKYGKGVRFIFDGVVRTENQAKEMLKLAEKEGFMLDVIKLSVSSSIMRSRIKKRNSEGSARTDDSNDEAINRRITDFTSSIFEILGVFNRERLYSSNTSTIYASNASPEQVYEQAISKIL